MTETDQTTRPGMECIGGLEMPKWLSKHVFGKSLKEHVEEIKAMEIRDNDVLVCAYGKCGKRSFIDLLCLGLIYQVISAYV